MLGLAALGGLIAPPATANSRSTPSGSNAAGKVRADAVPPSLLGLASKPEDVSRPMKQAGAKAYVSDIRLWSLREGDRLRATVEVGRFSADAPDSASFRAHVAEQVGSAAARPRRIGQQFVYVSAGNRQVFYLWYRGQSFVLLGVPADAGIGRSLLRVAIAEVKP